MAMDPLSLALAGGSLAAGMFGGEKDFFGLGTDYRRARKGLTTRVNRMQNLLTDATMRQEELLRSATKKAGEGIDRAKKEAAVQANQALSDTLTRENVLKGQIASRAGARGLSGTSVPDLQTTELSQGTSEVLGRIRAGLGEMYADLEMTRGAIESSGEQAIAANEAAHWARLQPWLGAELQGWTGVGLGGGSMVNLGGGGQPVDLSGLYAMLSDDGEAPFSWSDILGLFGGGGGGGG